MGELNRSLDLFGITMLQQILVGLLVAGVGGVVIYFSQQLTEGFGRVPRAEANLGSTRNMYVLVGFCMLTIGFLILFGVIPLTSPVENTTGI